VQAVTHWRSITRELAALKEMTDEQLHIAAEAMRVPFSLVQEVQKAGRLPVVNFAAGGIATPSDAALMMQLGCDGVFVGSGIFKSERQANTAKAIVEAVMNFNNPKEIARVSEQLGNAMQSLNADELQTKLAERGW